MVKIELIDGDAFAAMLEETILENRIVGGQAGLRILPQADAKAGNIDKGFALMHILRLKIGAFARAGMLYPGARFVAAIPDNADEARAAHAVAPAHRLPFRAVPDDARLAPAPHQQHAGHLLDVQRPGNAICPRRQVDDLRSADFAAAFPLH